MNVALVFFILANIMTIVYVVVCCSRISSEQKYMAAVFDEIIKNFSNVGDSYGK